MTEPDDSLQTLDQLAFELAMKPVGLLGKIGRTSQILKHYRFSQIARRVANVGMRKLQPGKMVGSWKPSTDSKLYFSDTVSELAKVVIGHHRKHPSHAQCDLENGKFVLLNHCVKTGQGLPTGELKDQTHLWRFQFHYHEFLLTQAAIGNWSQIKTFLSDWLSRYAPEDTKRTDDAWHPYCISRRLAAWVWLLSQAAREGSPLGEHLTRSLEESFVHQAEYLSHNLEWDLGGNHLIENATALAIAGCVVDSGDASEWRKKAFQVLKNELSNQVLSHGEHFELSPMYHCQILGNFLRIRICCGEHRQFKELLDPPIEKMLSFLRGILHPDGEIPMLADSNFHEAPSVGQIEDVVLLCDVGFKELESLEQQRIGDYFILRNSNVHAICDFGQIAAKNLPAHGHCDALNIEISVDGQRWIVDSGNFNYANDSMRHYCRSSIGHNVVTVDDSNQANVWSMFRMGSRPNLSELRNASTNDWSWASASHNGYANLGVQKITRLIALSTTSLVCMDFPTLTGNVKAKNCIGYLHFHPEVSLGAIELIGRSRFEVVASLGDTKKKVMIFADSATLEHGWYCEEFGKRRVGSVIRYVTELSSPGTGWILQECHNQTEIEFRKNGLGITMGQQKELDWTLV